MSNEPTIDCPHCGDTFKLTEALAGPLLEAERKRARADAASAIEAERTVIAEAARKEAENEFAAQLRARDSDIAERDAKLRQAQQAELVARKAIEAAEQAKQETELNVQRRVDSARAEVAAEAASKAQVAFEAQLEAVNASLAEKDARILQAQRAELAARKAKDEAERAKQEIELTVQRRVDASRAEVAAEAVRKATEAFDLKMGAAQANIAEKDGLLIQAQKAELAARKATEEAERAKQQVELDVQRRVDAIRDQVADDAARKATAALTAQLTAAQAAGAEKDAKLVAAQSAEIEALRLKAEAEQAKRETEHTVSRRLEEERTKVREQALRERDDEYRLKLGDKDAQLRSMQEQVEELRRRGSQGSQQLVGDVLEIDLLEVLQEAFPGDRFERARKGQRGADLLQTVLSHSGSVCGTILWESKRTKNWSEPWLAKLREDQREVKADLAVLATETMPEGHITFSQRDGIWFTALSCVVPVAAVLRSGLIEIAAARRAGALADSTKDHVFAYLTSPQFRQRISRVIESYTEMRGELDKEKRTALIQFSKREKQLERILGGITGFYGDLQGIVGSSLPPVEGLTLDAPADVAEKAQLTMADCAPALASNEEEALLS